MGRPYDWSPLGLDRDPVPGDPAAVSAESRRLGKTADELRAQISMLRKISSDSTLKGQYAGTLRAHAQQLSQDLGKVLTRYEQVAAATGTWSGELSDAQAASLTALRMAEGPYDQLRRMQAPQAPPSHASSAAKQQYAADKQQYQSAESSAKSAMASAQRMLGEATGKRDAAGARTAKKIGDASHDALSDSFWDQFKQMIGSVAGHLKLVATIIGYVATVCAILAVVLTGPLALVFLFAVGGLLLTELGIHTLLAATGNGSWLDVGLDIVALATLGYGGALDAGAEAVGETVEKAGTAAFQEEQGLFGAAKGLLDEASGLQTDAQALGEKELVDIAQQAKTVAEKTIALSEALVKPDLEAMGEAADKDLGSFVDVVKALARYGSVGMAKAIGLASRLALRFPDNTQIVQALGRLKVLGTRNAINFLSGTTIDALDKTLGLKWPEYNDFKDKASGALPAGLGVPVVVAAEVLEPTGFILHMTELASG